MRHLVVVGNGMVGQRLVDALRERDSDHAWRVRAVSEEPRRAYDRVALSSYFEGVSADELDLVDDACYDDERYSLYLAETAVRIDRPSRTVTTDRGRRIAYDALVLATGGFESGHAYGKALRTVKSCVGSTWCRYGVQDSVGLAIALELRYRGLRAPHKFKSAVSGCARECAEAQSKDFGVIATENGWNLFVGGNGGARPRHGDLLITDVDTDTLIRTIDRFLMFYIRTADRLQRTAAWVESLEGGISYLRSVIVDDALAICAELDEAMAAHVAGYEDEWAGVLNDPVRLKRFVSFVNAPQTPDPAVKFVDERGQIRPLMPATS